MKKILLFAAFLTIVIFAHAAYLKNVPVLLLQPDGDTLRCFATGDEYHPRLHDAQGYTILLDPATGFYCYARRQADGELQPAFVASSSHPINPALFQQLGIQPHMLPSPARLEACRKAWEVPADMRPPQPKSAKHTGTINNLVIFVRFAGDAEITKTFSSINSMFNDSSAASTSMFQYFYEASYGRLRLLSHFYPEPQGNSVLSYQDSFPRTYYSPYSTSNPNGYRNSTERCVREFAMVERCANWVNQNTPVDPSINLDYDNDGNIDNVVLVVKGTYVGWSEMLWPHKWSLYDRHVYINGKRLYTYNLQLEGSGSHYFSSSTLCHEMFHTLGAPDLYRYSENDAVSPAGSWDLMCSNTVPPQHTSAFMKMQYGGWLDSIPELTLPGTYALHSLADQTLPDGATRAYRIPSQDPAQYWVLEYRDQSEHFETQLPGSGLLIWRVDTRFDGNASYDGTTAFDGYYLMRPGASNSQVNGNPNRAHFGAHVSRPSFDAASNPHPWLNPYGPSSPLDTTFAITDIQRSADGRTLLFTYTDLRPCSMPSQLRCLEAQPTNARIAWQGRSHNYRLQWRTADSDDILSLTTNQRSAVLPALQPGQTYQFRVRGLCSEADSSDFSPWTTFTTPTCSQPAADTLGSPTSLSTYFPVATTYPFSLTQQIVRANEIGHALNLHAIEFLYSSDEPLTAKGQVALYLGHTSLTGFSTTSSQAQRQAQSIDTLQLLYCGPMPGQLGWNRLTLTHPFLYNGQDNLLLVIVDSSAAAGNSDQRYSTHSTTGNLAFAMFSNTTPPLASNPAADTTSSRRSEAKRAVMTLIGCDTTLASTETILLPEQDNPLILSLEGRTLRITGADHQPLLITDLLGRPILSTPHYDGRPIPLPRPGIYLIRAASHPAQKVLAR